jgi:hypothetical protein
VPAGPLAVRWLGYELDPPRAGSLGRAAVAFRNSGTAVWRSRGESGLQLSYHWLDERANPIVWDGLRFALPHPVEPGEEVQVPLQVRAPIPPGRYRLAFDLVDEGRLWFAELGNTPLELLAEVVPRIGMRALAAHVRPGAAQLEQETRRTLAEQAEPLVALGEAAAVATLVAGCLPAPD